MSEYSIIMTTTDNEEEARSLARGLVEKRLAACVQIAPITSHYIWKGSMEEATEFLLSIKTRSDAYVEVESFVNAAHSYETPELIQLPIVAGSSAYLSWISANTDGG